MAEYSIVLNLTGSAVSQTERLSANLATASVNAATLAERLRGVAAAARSIPTKTIRVQTASSVQNARNVSQAVRQTRDRYSDSERRLRDRFRTERRYAALASANPLVSRMQQGSNYQRSFRLPYAFQRRPVPQPTPQPQQSRRAQTQYTRHRANNILSFGSGFNIGGFSARLSTIIQPDAMGNLLRIPAGRLASALNVTTIALNVASAVGKALVKFTAGATIAPYIASGGIMMAALGALQSESFAEGVRLISRRHQAKQGLGNEYLRAEKNTDYLVASYGLDRSTTLSSINTMTGLGVGGSKRQLTVAEATNLTKVGGLISQHHGVPFERVMTNIQQLLVQDKPNLRDIRELLNQAPILGKYALKEMKERGIEGMDVRTYLKDQRNILSALKNYELSVATNAGMQARGQIGLAKQDAWAKIASNDPFWKMVGDRGSGIIGALATGINNLMTKLANNQEFKIMVRNIEYAFENIGDKGSTLIDKLIKLIDGIASRYGIDLGNRPKAKLETDKDLVLDSMLKQPAIVAQLRSIWEASNLPTTKTPEDRNSEFNNFLKNDLARFIQSNKAVRSSIEGIGKLKAEGDYPAFQRFLMTAAPNIVSDMNTGKLGYGGALAQVPENLKSDARTYVYRPEIRDMNNPLSAYAAYTLPIDRLTSAAQDFIKEMQKVGTLDPNAFKGTTDNSEDDIRQSNRDRRNLEIHFHDKLVEWNNTIMTGEPQQITEDIADNVEQMVSSAIQRALLGASNKVTTGWY